MNQNYCVSRRMVVVMPLGTGKDLEGLDTVSWAHLSIIPFEIALQNGYWTEYSFYSSWATLHLSLPCSVFLGDIFLKNCILSFLASFWVWTMRETGRRSGERGEVKIFVPHVLQIHIFSKQVVSGHSSAPLSFRA